MDKRSQLAVLPLLPQIADGQLADYLHRTGQQKSLGRTLPLANQAESSTWFEAMRSIEKTMGFG